MSQVLLIEDHQTVRDGLQLALTRQGHTVHAVGTGEQGLERLRTNQSDVVVLDLMLPGMDGFEVCRRIRQLGDLPIIMLTARNDDMDVVAGLEAGADDYVVKPVQARVLEARIRAVLRRTGGDSRRGGDRAGLEQYGALTIDRAALVVSKDGTPVSLAPTELRLLLELSHTPGSGAQPSATAGGRVGARISRRLATRGRLRPAGPRQDRGRFVGAGLHPDRAWFRIPVRAAVTPWRSLAAQVSGPTGPAAPGVRAARGHHDGRRGQRQLLPGPDGHPPAGAGRRGDGADRPARQGLPDLPASADSGGAERVGPAALRP